MSFSHEVELIQSLHQYLASIFNSNSIKVLHPVAELYSDPQNCWYVYNIWLVIIISQQPMKLCIYFLYHIDAMHVGYTPYKYYANSFSIQWDIIMFLPLGQINSFVADS